MVCRKLSITRIYKYCNNIYDSAVNVVDFVSDEGSIKSTIGLKSKTENTKNYSKIAPLIDNGYDNN